MDDAYVRAVMRFFVHLYERGWIYRANRIVNWCPCHETAISDLEVVHERWTTRSTYARYPLADGAGSITIATVRPATILADVAVAVHPDDERYRDAIGKEVVVPFVERRVPVIADERVEPDFGTGALKITPGHDPTDFEIGREHGLPEPIVIGLDGRMNEQAGEFAGLTQEEADERVLAWLQRARPAREAGALPPRGRPLRALRHAHRAADLAAVVVRDGGAARRRSRRCERGASASTPSRSTGSRSRSLEEIPDWCVSRQLWWGHQIPSGTALTAHDRRRDRRRRPARSAGRPSSSATRTSSTRGSRRRSGRSRRSAGPTRRPSCARFYPGDVNSTAREIIFLWVNRMILSGSSCSATCRSAT